jgi:aspartate racemase
MKTIGVLGGMSSVASGEYYRRINEGVNAHRGGHSAAELVLYSVDFGVVESFIREEQWERAGEYLAGRAQRLERAGAQFVILATNTLHRVADELQAAIGIPLVHIVDVTADAAIADGAKTLGLLGTAPVMEGAFYQERFRDHGVEILVPGEQDRALVHRVIFEELTRGVIDDGSRQEYVRIMGDLAALGAQGIVLGCTEISLLVSGGDLAGTDLSGTILYDTTALHVDRAVRISLGLHPLSPESLPSAV